jgi:hypothetical protein
MPSAPGIRRTAPPSVRAFASRHRRTLRPVVISGLFRNQPLARLASVRTARRELAHVLVEVQQEYSRQFGGAAVKPKSFQTIGAYLDLAEAHPETDEMCMEFELPLALRRRFRLPKYCQGDPAPRLLLFLGNAGNHASLHFDSDLRHVLLVQVFGRKRVVLIPPRESAKLLPDANLSRVRLENMTEAEKAAFSEFAGGYRPTVIGAGDTLYIPPLFWHYVDYLDTSMSIAIRFGRNPYGDFIAEHLHMDTDMQRLALATLDEASVPPALVAVIDELRTLCAARAATPAERLASVRALVAKTLTAWGPERELYAPAYFARGEDREVLLQGPYRRTAPPRSSPHP